MNHTLVLGLQIQYAKHYTTATFCQAQPWILPRSQDYRSSMPTATPPQTFVWKAGINAHVLGLLSDLLTTTPQQPSVRHSRESYPGLWLTSSIQIQYANHYTTANLSFSPVQFSDNTTVTKYGETFYGCLTALNEEIKVDLEIINHKNVVGGGESEIRF